MPAAGWILDKLGEWGVMKALDMLLEGYQDITGDLTPREGTLDAKLLDVYKEGIPNTYRRYGVLFEIVWVKGADGYDALLVPRGYGQSPSHAVINERTFATNHPDLSADLKSEIARRELVIADAARRNLVTPRRQGLWLEYNPALQEWSSSKQSIQAVEATADQQMRAAMALASLHASKRGLEKFRLQAIAWQNYYDQYQDELARTGIKQEIAGLVAANEAMTMKLEAAVDEMRRADASAGFFNFLSLLSAGLNLANAALPESNSAAVGYVTLRDYNKTAILQFGEELVRINARLRDRLIDGPGGPLVVPEWEVKEEVHKLVVP